MKRQELIDEVAARSGVARGDVQMTIDTTLTVVTETLAAGGEVGLQGFGRFHTAIRGGRAAADPRTGAPIRIPDATVARFTPGARLKAAVR